MAQKNQYRIVIDWSDEDQAYIARVPELDGVVTHGDSEEEALKMAHEAIELHLESLEAHNEPIPEPVSLKNISGQLPLRMGKYRHREVIIQAHNRGIKSLNEYLCNLIDEDLKGKPLREKLNKALDDLELELIKEGLRKHRKNSDGVMTARGKTPQLMAKKAAPVAAKKLARAK